MPVSFAQHAADAAALLGHLGIQWAHIAGHSTGAAIGLQLAVDHPDVVHTLALLEPPLPSAPGAEKFFEKARPSLAAYEAGDREEAMARFLTVACSLDWETCRMVVEQHIPGGMAQAMADADTFFASYLPALSARQFGPIQAATIARPVRSVVGIETEPFFAEGHNLLRSWFPRLEECTIEGAVHLLRIQRPEPVARGLADFFARHPFASA
jgi:pimeloyl-ACP methyl ester carboxylesterase